MATEDDTPFLPPQPPLMSAVRARDTARSCKGMANYLRERGDAGTARILEQQSAWWMAYAIALSQIPPGAVEGEG
jgi:hypothetical protein